MANPYTRQSSFSDGDTINSALFNDEYDQLVEAFSTSGHTHDGSTGEGAPITKLGPTQDVVISSTTILPKTNNTVDLGSSSLKFKNAFFSGNVNVDGIVTHSGNIILGNAATDTLTINATIQGSSLVFEGATANAHEMTLAIPDVSADKTITFPNATDTLVGKATTDVLTNKTLTSAVLNTGISGTALKDEDNMASNSATHLASQQSIKAYVDASTGAISDQNFTNADHSKLDGIETNATADQTAAQIKTALENGIDSVHYVNGSIDGEHIANNVALGGSPTTTTQAESDDSTKVATTAYVTDKITTLIGGAPSTLNDLNELAEAINDDANYNSTLTTALGTKLPKAGGAMTGNITMAGTQTVDGRDLSVDGAKLDNIEASATADQTAAQIKTALENGIDSVHYVDGSIDTVHIGNDQVTADKLANSINSAISANTSKTGISSAQANAITANTAKTGISSAQTSAITANTAKTTNATHSGEVTGATALTIADNIVDEANLKISNSPTNGYVLTAQSGNTGGMTWATAPSTNATHSGEVTGSGALTIADNIVDEANLKVSNSPSNGYFLSAQSGATGGMTWAEVDALPSQSGNSGKFLTTDATNASWATLNTDSNSTTKGLYEMANTIAANYVIGNNNNAMSAGPITINSNVSVTVPSGSTWVIA